MPYRLCVFLVAIILLSPLTLTWAADKVSYQDDVRPLLREHCFACHNQDDATAGLALDSFEGLTTGGASGEVVAAGDLDGSRLWKLVTHQEEPTMPPDNKLPEKKLQVLRVWIEGGLLKDAGSKPLKSSRPEIAKIDATKLGQPVGEPAVPEQLFHEPVLWTPHTGPVDAIATSPWAPLAAVAWQRQVSFYDTNTFELLGILPYLDGVPRVVRFSRDGSFVLLAGGRHAAAGSAALFDVKTGARLVTLGDELDIVLAADISPDLSLVAIGGPKKKVRVYRVADSSLAFQISKHTDWITAVGFSPDGRLLATADRSGSALLWQAAAGHERGDLRGHKGAITSLDWRADAAMLATASEDGTVKLWNPAGKQIKSVVAHKGGVLSVRFAKEGNWVTAGRDQKVKTWKSGGGAIADLGKLPGMALAAAFTQDGAKVIASDYSGEVCVIDTASKKQVATLQANPPSLAQRLVDAENSLQQTQRKLQTLQKHEVTQLAALDQGEAAHTAHENKLKKAQDALATKQNQYQEFTELATSEAATQKQQAAEKSVQNAEANLAQVANETAGLPDLEKLAQQHDQAQAEAVTARTKFEQAQKRKAFITAQQARFATASERIDGELERRQAHQEKLTKQSGRLETKYQQAAEKLVNYREQLEVVANQLKTLQAKLSELQSTETKLHEQEKQLATQLEKKRTEQGESQQKMELLEASKRDFVAAEKLRQVYLDSAERAR